MTTRSLWRRLLVAAALAVPGVPAHAVHAAHAAPQPVADTTWVDHDGQPIHRPPDWEPGFYGHMVHQAFVEPVTHAFDIPDKLLALAGALGAHPRREAANVNAFDEAPNSTWFTNRNHVHAVPVGELAMGPDSTLLPEKPWTITHPKHGGASAGFQIKDAAGRKWLIKLDWRGYPRLSSGADMVARTLLHAAGYNVPHNEPVRFTRADLRIADDLARGTGKDRFSATDLDSALARGAVLPDGAYSAIASLFLPGHPLGAASIDRKRPGDGNDWYAHTNRREFRGFYVVASWIGYWDTKDANLLDVFDSTGVEGGHVVHYILDSGSSMGADADGLKRPESGYENAVDFGWMGRRLVTLGFAVEPWRRARQDTGIPSAGRFESAVFDPAHFAPEVPNPAYRAMTDRDAYWGAKIVASFSDAQIRAAVDAAHYDDPRASELLTRLLIERRDKVARYWFGRVAPLDFFNARDGAIHFHDLAVDVGLSRPRAYDVEIRSSGGGGAPTGRHVRLDAPELPFVQLGSGAKVTLEIAIDHASAKPARVELTRTGDGWTVTRVRHG
jgi:hypothetical protein